MNDSTEKAVIDTITTYLAPHALSSFARGVAISSRLFWPSDLIL